MPPKSRALDHSYFPGSGRNTNLQGEEHGDHNVEDRVLNDPILDKDNIIDTDEEDEINRLI